MSMKGGKKVNQTISSLFPKQRTLKEKDKNERFRHNRKKSEL